MNIQKTAKYFSLLYLIVLLSYSCSEDKIKSHKPVHQFALTDVTLLNGPFKKATKLNRQVLLKYEPDRFLSKFRSEAGMEPKAEHYEGWESETLAGHSLGHYLSACALMYQTSGDQRLLDRVKYIVDELKTCQLANGNGYFGAFPNGKEILENEVAKGDIRAYSFELNGIWAPFYTQHKIMAGLRDAYHLCRIQKALEVERKFADWLYTITENLNDEQIQLMLNCEHGGMNEVLADLYADTNNKKYLKLSHVFHHKAILDSLAAGIDILAGKHGNTQVPKLIGLARRYELEGSNSDKKATEFFWDRVVNHHSYVTGGHGNHEYFGEPDKLRNRLSNETTETCNVYNMLKLTRHLFEWNPNAKFADYYERALFNQILSSQNPDDGRVIYHLSLEMGGYKNYENPFGFTCCVGTGMENHAKYGKNIYYCNEDEFYVTQFIASRVKWNAMGVVITQTTDYPNQQGTALSIECTEPQEFTLYIRYPYWAEAGINISVNGEEMNIDQERGSFIPINRVWNNDDKIDLKFPFTLRLETMPDDSNRVAVMYGPLVMAGDLSSVDDYEAEKDDFVPVLITQSRNPVDWFKNLEDETNRFVLIEGIGRPRGFKLLPFYEMNNRRYSIYWDIFTEASWNEYQKREEEKKKQQKILQEITFDFFQPGDMQSEKDHKFTGEKIRVEEFKHRMSRVADRGGWLSYDMNVELGKDMVLVINYWGGFTGSKTFDILVEEKVIATENISGKKDGEFLNVFYNIPPSIIKNKQIITVKFLPHAGNRAGPFFNARTMTKEDGQLFN